ncbi:hypothetical protein BGZ65_011098 [Modicella reniformis]|uniref:Uncharacterized protein n=1 Tax=Modicella reniformis TaxID=1440133 RepID=A0A9P6M7V4_9FUNG|nr:hypothetical protein BGZ65_011098 [Modicella reniformis]
MGQTGWWSIVKAAGYEPPVYDMSLLSDALVEVDLMSTFYSAVIARVLEKKRDGKTAREAGVILAHILASVFPPDQTILHVDGIASREKAEEHARRATKVKDALESLETIVESIEARSNNGKKVSRAKWEASESEIKRSFRMTEDDKSQLVEGLRTRFQTCRCARREDVVPPGFPVHITRRVVVTSDSDFLAYGGIHQILRPLPHSRNYGLYCLNDILQAFGFSSPHQLVALACVSANDYGKNVPGFGIKTNAKLVKGISLDKDVENMVQSYITTIQERTDETVDFLQFLNRFRIFHLRTDSVIDSGKSHVVGPPPTQVPSTPMSEDQAPELGPLSRTLHVELSSLDPFLAQGFDPSLAQGFDPLSLRALMQD